MTAGIIHVTNLTPGRECNPSNRYSLLAREGHAGTAVAMGNNEVFVAFSDNVIRSYDSESGKLLATLKGHRSRVTHLEAGGCTAVESS
jgi:WD40 repeat protein